MCFKHRPALLWRRDLAQAISKKAELAVGGDGRVELAHPTCSSIARVHKSLFTLCTFGDLLALALVEGFKISAAHVDLAPDLNHCGRICRKL